MRRREFLSLGSAALGTSFMPRLLPSFSKKKRNIVFILVDDLGWMDLSCQGSKLYKTPNLDKLTKTSMRFTNAYASCPVCSPTRASIMTGKYPARLNITDWIPGRNPRNEKLMGPEDLHALPLSEITIAEALKDKGYKTFFAGKWHLGSRGHFPEDQGFDINKGGHHKGSPPGGYYTPYNNPKLRNGPPGEYLPDRLTNESIKFMEDNKENPFLLFLAFYTVHSPIQPCKRLFMENTQRTAAMKHDGPSHVKERNSRTKLWQDDPAYASMVQAFDENIGRLLKKLDELKKTDDTVIIFTSDNGGLATLRRGKAPTSNAPLRSGKGWCYEGGIRVPLIVSIPGIVKPGSTCDVPVTSTDFYPTILDLVGISLKPKQHMDGMSLEPLLKGKKKLKREAIFWHFPHYHGTGWAPGAAVRAGNWKLIEFYEENRHELYNLKSDLGERKNLVHTEPGKAKELLDMLHAWQKDVGAKMATPNPGFKQRKR